MSYMNFMWINEFIILVYAIALIGYFIDFIHQSRKVNRFSFWALTMVWLLQTVFLFGNVLGKEKFPILTIYDGLYFYAWLLITFSLIINRLFRVDFFVFFTNVVGFFIMVLHIFTRIEYQFTDVNQINFQQEALITHITLALLSYGFFTFSFIFSIMYLLEYHLLKQKKWTTRLRRLGDLNQLDRYSYLAILLALPVLLIAIILGVIWGYTSNDPFYWYDMKTIGSFAVLLVYGIILFLRVGMGFQGKKMATFNVYAFLFLFVNYFLFSTLSNFHF